ncbi:hypothetical protein F5Y14DRAFT_401661 [Nemania sp. NC0429]|nr:hypothetical protein F5Y14DRAFT_401661 [Nemania sp. NC0429]
MAQQIAAFGDRQIETLGRRNSNGDLPSPLDIFEASTARVLTDVDQYMKRDTFSLDDMGKERNFMFRIDDIREELVMVQTILAQQLKILQSFIKDYEDNNPDKYSFLDRNQCSTARKQERTATRRWGAGKRPRNRAERSRKRATKLNEGDEKGAMRQWEVVKESRHTIERYQERARKIDRDAEMVEKRIQDQLNLKRTYASMRDARTSLTLGTAVIRFTVITIIFAPLAFVTALFALPIDSLLRNQFVFDGKGMAESSDSADEPEPMRAYTTGYVGTWFAVAEVVSLIVTILLVVIFLWFQRYFYEPRGNRSATAGMPRGHGDGSITEGSIAGENSNLSYMVETISERSPETSSDEEAIAASGSNANAGSGDIESGPGRRRNGLRKRVLDSRFLRWPGRGHREGN